MSWRILAIASLTLMGCKTVTEMKAQSYDQGDESEAINTYDGAADSQDSLPDCTPELAGSFFWVRSDKAGYDCTTTGQWVARANAPQPSTEDGDDGFGPRSLSADPDSED